MGFFDENAPTPEEQAQMDAAVQAQQQVAARERNTVSGWNGNTGINGGGDASFYPQAMSPDLQAHIAGLSHGGGGDVASQFRAQLQAAYPTKSKDANWLNQQTQYFVDKYNTHRGRGETDQQVLNYFLDRAAGAQAGGADVAEAGKYAGQDFGTLAQQQGFGGLPVGSFAQQAPIGTLGNYAQGQSLGPAQTVNAQQINAPDAPVINQVHGASSQAAQIGNAPVVNAAQVQTPGQVTAERIQAAAPIAADRVQAQQIAGPERLSTNFVQGPQALTATTLQAPGQFQGVTEADLKADPSYQFRLNQGLGALEAANSAKGLSRTGGAYKGLIDYGQQAASQEYANVYGRKLGEFNNAFQQNATVNQQNNANTAQAYGLTNQYQQAAALANQQNAFNVGSTNAANTLNANQFNASQANTAALANQGANLTAAQFNAAQANDIAKQNSANALQAGQFNTSTGLQAGQFNAGAQNQAAQFNAGNALNAAQFNAGNQQQTGLSNAQLAQQANLANASNQLGAYSAYAPLQLSAQGQNAANALQAANQNNAANLNVFNANTNAGLGYGNLNLGQYNALNNAALGYGNLGVAQGQLALGQNRFGMDAQQQAWQQANTINEQNWNHGIQLGTLGTQGLG